MTSSSGYFEDIFSFEVYEYLRYFKLNLITKKYISTIYSYIFVLGIWIYHKKKPSHFLNFSIDIR